MKGLYYYLPEVKIDMKDSNARRGRLDLKFPTKSVCFLSLGFLIVLGLMIQRAESQSTTVRARNIEILDARGEVRIKLTVDSKEGPVIRLFDEAGMERNLLSLVFDGTPRIIFRDATGKTRLALAMHSDGTSGMELRDARGQVRMSIQMLVNGDTRMWMWDAFGKEVFKAP